MGPTLLIDGDVFVYQNTAAVETPVHWGNDLWTLHADASEAKGKLDLQLQLLQEDLKAESMIIAFSDLCNFRHTILPTYKSNRVRRKPVAYAAVRDYCRKTYRCLTLPSLEADDTLGILSTSNWSDGITGERIIVTVDKDLRSVPGSGATPRPADCSGRHRRTLPG